MLRRLTFLVPLFALPAPAFAQIAPAPGGQPLPPQPEQLQPAPQPPSAPPSAVPAEIPPAPPAQSTLTPTEPTDPSTAGAPPSDSEAPSLVSLRVFADAYYGYNTSQVGLDMHPAHRAYNRENGFSLSFAGTDITWDNSKVGATLSLRFGPSVPQFFVTDQSPFGIQNVLQAFATWHATEQLTLDFGQFGTIYGAEVAESWVNLNYTRGALYFAMQPFWHTGLRATYKVADELTVRAMVVNGANSIVEDGKGRPSLGLQASYADGPLTATLGYLGSTDPNTDAYFDHFFDLIASYQAGNASVVLNADLSMDKDADGNSGKFYGASLAAGYRFVDEFGLALRGEYLADPDGLIWGQKDMNLITGTLTADYRPVPNLVLRLDNRIEKADQEIFTDRDSDATDIWFQSVLGVVVTSSLL